MFRTGASATFAIPKLVAILSLAVAAGALAQSLEDARADFRAGRLEQAGAKLALLARKQPQSADIQYCLGLVYAAQGRREAAVAPFGRACELGLKTDNACYLYALNLYALTRYDAAVEPFERALAAAAGEARWRVLRAAARNFEALGRGAEAERRFQAAIRLYRGQDPRAEDPRIDYGGFLFRQGRTAEALAPLEEAARAPASAARAHAELGRVLLQLDRLDRATEQLETALKLDPGDWPAHLLLGRAYVQLGRTAEGERELQIGRRGLERR